MDNEVQIQNIIREELLRLRDRIIDNHVRAGQKASGRTIESMRIEITSTGGALFGRRAFGTLETGRQGGRIPKNFVQIILQWMTDKGIEASPIPYVRKPSEQWSPKYTPKMRGQLSLAGAIAHKIAIEGTALYREGGRADIYSNAIPETVESLKERLAGVFGLEIDTINLNAAKQ